MIRGRFSAAALVSSMALIGGFEGYRQAAYSDPVGVSTVCFGSTNFESNQQRPEQCAALLARDVLKASRVLECFTVALDEAQQTAVVSWAYNVGVGAACSSTLVRRANAGEPAEAWCAELERWNKGRILGVKQVLPGLVRRREYERAVCEGSAPWQALI
ncbi:MAG: lysozyme [Oceanococcaceae bacterium]